MSLSSERAAGIKADNEKPPRPPNRVLATWRGDLRFDAGRPSAASIRIDGNGETGPGPMDTMLCALGTCAASDVVLILEKSRTPPATLEVEVVGTRSEGTPRPLRHALLEWRLTGDRIERAAAERAIDLSIAKYCSVRDSLDRAIPIEWTLELNGARGTTRRSGARGGS